MSLLACFFELQTNAQISPPGLDGAKGVGWVALGFSQKISNKVSTTIYAGGSLQSDPNSLQFLKKPAIFVLNQETYYQFNNRWQLAWCTSLRKQEFYSEDEPYEPLNPPWKIEVRHYLRLFYRYQVGRWSFAHSFRPELRTFYTTSWSSWAHTPTQVRFRLKGQCNYKLTEANSIILANEFLFASNHDTDNHRWTQIGFTEDRLSTYFRHSFKKPSLIIDAGFMHQFWRENGLHYTTYLAFDFIFQNPFGQKKTKA
ncbi:hypothetical protein WSM22_02320 [Cytophagales bacterium WSM2-2]|nr:hypothetical protein WSM22_02320 [Cytophagales bacterium WSM2-2]